MSKIKTIKLSSYKKKSGKLIPISFDKKFPINVKRIFYIFGKKNEYRGDHAHKKCKQLFIPISGNISLNLSPKKNIGVLVSNLVWCRLKFLTKNSIVLVLCDRKYEFKDYIEKYAEFKKILKIK